MRWEGEGLAWVMFLCFAMWWVGNVRVGDASHSGLREKCDTHPKAPIPAIQ
jgi:hypothetical protein